MRGAIAWLVGVALGISAACFTPPNDDVLFSCDRDEAPTCPDSYTCEADGCCHRDGSDVEASFGACRLTSGSISETGTPTTTSGSSGSSDSSGSSTGATTSGSSESSGGSDDTGGESSSSG